MGVTKKKAYLKPEITKFEMKMEASFLAGSKDIIDIIIPTDPTDPEEPTEVELVGLIPEECTESVVKNLAIGGCDSFGVNTPGKEGSGKCPLWDMILEKGMTLNKGEILYIKRTNTDSYKVSKNNICN